MENKLSAPRLVMLSHSTCSPVTDKIILLNILSMPADGE